MGSLVIASLLGSVASFMIYTNSNALGEKKIQVFKNDIWKIKGCYFSISLVHTICYFKFCSTLSVGRSIPDDRLHDINQELEGDIMVRQVYDVKGIDMGNGIVRYKVTSLRP